MILFNHADTDFEIKKGDRIAQLILERISMANIAVVDELSGTSRGDGGFGSTGVNISNMNEASKKPKFEGNF